MKVLRLLTLLLAMQTVTSCITDGAYDCPETTADGDLYIGINIPISQSGTRAVGYDNGLANEYQVHDFILVLLKSDTDDETAATVHSAYKLETTDFDKNTASGGQITENYNYVVKVNSADMADIGTKHYYALVIINANDQFTVNDKKLYAGGVEKTTLASLKNLQLTTVGNATNGFFMTNSPVSSKPGGDKDPSGANVTWLAKIDASRLFDTEQRAKNMPAADIYVERAAVKVQVVRTADDTFTDMVSAELKANGITSASTPKWVLDNYNTSFYAVRNFNSADLTRTADGSTYRMAAPTSLQSYHNEYRIHWGEGINYTGDGTWLTTDAAVAPYKGGIQMVGGTPLFDHMDHTANYYATDKAVSEATNDIVYCAENTLAADNMKQDRTTRVVIGIQFGAAGQYTTPANPDKFVGQDDAKAYLGALVPGLVKTWAETNVKAASREAFAENTGNAYYTLGNDLKMDDKKRCYRQLTTVNSGDIYEASVTDALSELNDYLKTELTKRKVLSYVWHQAYYPIRIKHFGDDETPWAEVASKDYDVVYPATGRENKYLGRYGVLRNTWYLIKIKSIKHIGSNVYPELTDDPDDEASESWIDYEIIQLPWATHEQNFDFK